MRHPNRLYIDQGVTTFASAMRTIQRAPKPAVTKPKYKPRPHQVAVIDEHVAFYKRKGFTLPDGRRVIAHLEGSDMGTGKTFIALFTAQRLGKRLFVVCPKPATAVWERWASELKVDVIETMSYEKLARGATKWCKNPQRIAAYEDYAKRYLEYQEKLAQVGEDKAYMILEPKKPIVEDNTMTWDLPKDVLVVLDEGHRCKGIESLNSEILLALGRQEIPTMICSATAATSPADMRALGYALGMHSSSDFSMWARNHGCITSQWGNLEYIGGDPGLVELHRRIFEPQKGRPALGCRIRIADLPKGAFPETQITAEAYDMGDDAKKIQKVYHDMEAELIAFEMNSAGARHPLTIMLRARQKVELLKVPAFAEMAKDAVASGMRVLVFLNFTESIFALQKRLKTNCLFYGGNTRERNEWLDKFQRNEKGTEVMILNVAAGAEVISAQDLDGKHPRLSLISPTWAAIKMHQTFGRTHRDGGKSKSIQRVVYTAGTVEQKVCDKVRSKLNNMTCLIDGDLIPEHLERFLNRVKAKGSADYAQYVRQIAAMDDEER